LYKPEGEVSWRCININCPAQVAERLIHFTSKDAMDIHGFGAATVVDFAERGFLKSIPDIYHLDFSEVRKLEGWKDKSVFFAMRNDRLKPVGIVCHGGKDKVPR